MDVYYAKIFTGDSFIETILPLDVSLKNQLAGYTSITDFFISYINWTTPDSTTRQNINTFFFFLTPLSGTRDVNSIGYRIVRM